MYQQDIRKGVGRVTRTLYLVKTTNSNGPDNNHTPGGQQFIPREDKRAIAHAFYKLHRTVRWLKRVNNGMTERQIEDVLRDEHRDLNDGPRPKPMWDIRDIDAAIERLKGKPEA